MKFFIGIAIVYLLIFAGFFSDQEDVKENVKNNIAPIANVEIADAQSKSLNPLPSDACNFLEEYDLKDRRGWQDSGISLNDGIGNYGCLSGLRTFKKDYDLQDNNFGYYVYGEPSRVQKIEFVLNVNEPKRAKSSHRKMKEITSVLYTKIFGKEISKKMENAIIAGREDSELIENVNIELTREKYGTGGIPGGYTLQISFSFRK